MPAKLTTYRRKRDFRRTPEPSGSARPRSRGNSFVVQKHAARRLHYDFRLELDGVLKSWAVPKGPSLEPGEKRLAVQTEDHPLEYGRFHGVIPEGEYGAGKVELWDRGAWTPDGDPREGLARGRLKFQLRGKKLHGGWALIRMGGRNGSRNGKENWLLIKERDGTARAGSAEPAAPKEAAARRVRAPRGKRRPALEAVSGAREGTLPDFVAPQLATLVGRAPAGEDWLHEIKLDGYRVLARIERGRARLLTRNGKDWSPRFPGIAAAAARLKVDRALLGADADPLFRARRRAGRRLLRPGLRARTRGHRLQAEGGTVPIGPGLGLGEGEVRLEPGIRHRRLHGSERHARGLWRPAPRRARQGRRPDLCRPRGHRLRPAPAERARDQAQGPRAAEVAILEIAGERRHAGRALGQAQPGGRRGLHQLDARWHPPPSDLPRPARGQARWRSRERGAQGSRARRLSPAQAPRRPAGAHTRIGRRDDDRRRHAHASRPSPLPGPRDHQA